MYTCVEALATFLLSVLSTKTVKVYIVFTDSVNALTLNLEVSALDEITSVNCSPLAAIVQDRANDPYFFAVEPQTIV